MVIASGTNLNEQKACFRTNVGPEIVWYYLPTFPPKLLMLSPGYQQGGVGGPSVSGEPWEHVNPHLTCRVANTTLVTQCDSAKISLNLSHPFFCQVGWSFFMSHQTASFLQFRVSFSSAWCRGHFLPSVVWETLHLPCFTAVEENNLGSNGAVYISIS